MPRFGLALAALCASLVSVASVNLAIAQEFEAPPLPSLTEEYLEEPSCLATESPEYYGGMPVEPPSYELESPSDYEIYDVDEIGAAPTCPGLCFTVQLDAIFLRRSESTVLPLVNGANPYGAQNLDLPYRLGPRISIIGYNLAGSNWDAEFTYFDVNGMQTQQASAGATTLFTNPAVNFGARTVSSTYRESLYSTELNLRRRFGDRWTFINGFRWIQLRSDLATDLVGASHRINVNNHLYGYQLGGNMKILSWNNFDLDTWLKAGIYGNAADQETNTVGIGGAAPAFGASGGRAAFVGEIGLVGTYRWNDWLSFRAGYQAIWLDGLAIAPDQILVSNVATGAAVLDTSKTLLYHGGIMGMEMNW